MLLLLCNGLAFVNGLAAVQIPAGSTHCAAALPTRSGLGTAFLSGRRGTAVHMSLDGPMEPKDWEATPRDAYIFPTFAWRKQYEADKELERAQQQQDEDAQREWHAWEAQLRAHAQAQFDNAAQQQGYGLSAADQAKAKLEATFLLDAVETAASEAAAEARRASAPLAEGWREAVAPGGRVYYYNEARETTWVKPVVEEDAPPEE